MPSNETINPYSTTSAPNLPPDVPVFRFILVPLFFMALVLLFQSLNPTLACFFNLSRAMSFSLSRYGAANFFVDMTFCVTGLFGGLCIFLGKPIGWWFAMIHCVWYLAWHVVIRFANVTFGWLSYRKDEGYYALGQPLLIGCIGIAFLALTPTMTFLNVSPERRLRKILRILVITVTIAFVTDWWAASR